MANSIGHRIAGEFAQAIYHLLELMGEDPDREGLRETPRRVQYMWLSELTTGYGQDPSTLFTTFENEGYSGMVIVKKIPFFSLCEHHLVPFHGHAHIGYIPSTKIVGISKLVRVLEMFSKRLQVQERLTDQIADTLCQYLEPQGVMVILEAEHLCMAMRGVQRPGTITVSSAVRGVFESDTATREEFLSLIE